MRQIDINFGGLSETGLEDKVVGKKLRISGQIVINQVAHGLGSRIVRVRSPPVRLAVRKDHLGNKIKNRKHHQRKRPV